jgi:Mn-dependent DtxR family transcriptional regulator
MPTQFTPKQGQHLSFIYYYTMINGRAPAESDIQHYFRVSAPSVHQMILSLERGGFISRIAGQSRSIKLKLPREQIPDLVPVDEA